MSLTDMVGKLNNPDITDEDLPDILCPDYDGTEDYNERAHRENVREPQQMSLDGSEPGRLMTAQAALDFIFAGNAYFTLRSRKTGQRYTYRVSKPHNEDRKQIYPNAHFVSLLTGPQNTDDYQYLGMVQDRRFRLTRASKMTAESKPVAAFRWTLEALLMGTLPSTLEIWHEGRCGRCGRKLTVPESIAAGIGPECAGRM